jgi:hypothetical protein
MSYGNESNKDDAPDVEDMVPVRTYSMGENKGNSPDDINGRLPLNERHRAAVGAEPDEYVWLRVRALKNDEEVVTKQRIYNSGRGISLEHNDRKKLDLEPNDEVKYWIAPIENGQRPTKGDQTGDKAITVSNAIQSAAEDTDDQRDKYVWLKDTDSTTFHHVDFDTESSTVCGIDFSDHEAVTTDDPGGFLDECRNCVRTESDELSNRQLIEGIGDMADFELTRDDRTNYLKREQLVAIWERMVEQEQKIEELEKQTD